MRDWESTFRSWAQGPSKTEKDKCDNAIRAIKDAINSSYNLQNLGVEVFLQGSYRNHVNVRQDSDVDIGVVCTSIFYTDYPEGTDNSTFNNNSSSYTLNQFKDEVDGSTLMHQAAAHCDIRMMLSLLDFFPQNMRGILLQPVPVINPTRAGCY